MANSVLLYSSTSFLLFQIVLCTNSAFDYLVPSNLSLPKDYENSMRGRKTLGSLSETQFCESILSLTNQTLRKSLYATLFSARNETYLDDKDGLLSCCHFLHKCDAQRSLSIDHSINDNIPHCECVKSFRHCLKKLNTSLSNEFEFIYSINTTRCSAEFDETTQQRNQTTITGIEKEDSFIKKKIIFDNAVKEIIMVAENIGCGALQQIQAVEAERDARQIVTLNNLTETITTVAVNGIKKIMTTYCKNREMIQSAMLDNTKGNIYFFGEINISNSSFHSL